MSKLNFCVVCMFVAAAASTPVYAVSLDSLGPVDIYASMPSSVFSLPVVSGDGSTVAGTGGAHGFTWTPSAGRVDLPGLYNSFPTALSYDGSIAVGGSVENDGQWHPVSWQNGIRSQLEIYPRVSTCYATGLSSDGQMIFGIGAGASDVFKWTEHAVWSITGLNNTRGNSADGATLAGNTIRRVQVGGGWEPSYMNVPTAAVWHDGAVTSLGSLTTDNLARSYAWGISPDGNVAYGYSSSSQLFNEGFRWTATDGLVGLGAAPGRGGSSYETCMKASNYDGSVLVGWTAPAGKSGERAIIWDAQNGIRYLDEVLASQYGIGMAGWQLQAATGMSWDGQTIAGYGLNPQGVREGWVVNIPEPASLLLLAAGLAITGRRFRTQ